MKKIYLSLLIVFLFQACTSDMEEILQVGEVETSKVTTRQAQMESMTCWDLATILLAIIYM
ncbi:hypothetical protein [Bacteroides ovatus]|uniref:hypothetical protein n=1 Tax=Bacteroides ovatus TaxID=28116 RepID=UPI001899BC48|nr:hypothetical protein [Bacteroides ovatus]MDC2625049.1 hypothetical protein [Bacteroides ovatus]MDC2638920.1 hypothetical protein [Bacteroides ovatus]MDC2653301.1 hypothetical protein [Bacteroides ovatus]